MNMGLFSKSPAEKRLKELTGGMFLNSSFKAKLERAGLTTADGFIIQNEIKESIKRDEVKAEGVETRINFLIEEKKKAKKAKNLNRNKLQNRSPSRKSKRKSTIAITDEGSDAVHVLTKDEIEKRAKTDHVKKVKYLVNQEHYLEKCPACNADVLKGNKFCYKCGFELSKGFKKEIKTEDTSSNETKSPALKIEVNKKDELKSAVSDLEKDKKEEVKSVADELSQLEQQYNETKAANELSELEKLYNKKVSSKYSPKFKFAYVLYLNEINKNPNKSINADYYQYNYETKLAKIKKQAKEDEFVGEGSPLLAAKGSTVKDLKKLLKKHDLMVSGTKAELIERLGENLSEEELKQAFPKKVFSVTEKGLEFIEENKYVFYYDKTTPIRTNMEVEEYDSIFEGVDDFSDENIHKLLIDFLEKREDDFVNKKNWGGYRYNFMALARVYKDSGDNLKVLDNDFKLFIAGINNFNDYTNQSEPAYGYIGKTYSNELIELLHSLSLSIDELKARFNESYDDLKYPDLKISKEESLVYLLKIFNGEDILELTEEIHSKYPFSNEYQF